MIGTVLIIRKKSLRYTFLRSGIYYLQVCLHDGQFFRKSLLTDSYREASDLMVLLMPQILQVKKSKITIESLNSFCDSLILPMHLPVGASSTLPTVVYQQQEALATKPNLPILKIGDAWKQYKKEKGLHWTLAIAQANERFMEVMLEVLGSNRNVYTIEKSDIRQVM